MRDNNCFGWDTEGSGDTGQDAALRANVDIVANARPRLNDCAVVDRHFAAEYRSEFFRS